jgi:hypothetical protein
MKQKDISVIIIVAGVSALFSFILSNALFGSPQNRQEKVETVDVITAEFTEPDKRYFNNESVNPTLLIEIKGNDNSKPFN